jgi:hypothetical protein
MKVGARRMILASAGITVAWVIGVASAAFSTAGQATITSPGKLILSGDITLFGTVGPDVCTMRNRFKRGEGVGFRITAIDGGTGDIESSAEVVIHITHGGKTVDVPARYRGHDDPKGPYGMIPYLWTARWNIPADAPIGIVRFKATAKDNKGRTAEWTVFQNSRLAQLTIVE